MGYKLNGLDDLDRNIISILEDNPRTYKRKISEKLGRTDTVIGYRIRRLENMDVLKKGPIKTVKFDESIRAEKANAEKIEKLVKKISDQNDLIQFIGTKLARLEKEVVARR